MNWFSIGDVQVAKIVEFDEPFMIPTKMFAEATPEALAPILEGLEPGAICPASGKIMIPIQSYLLRTASHTVLIDTCVGDHKSCTWYPRWHERTGGAYLADLAALGVRPEDVDFVLCTHLHVDHCGWNTQRENGHWLPTFPNAKYVFTRKEVDYAEALARKTGNPPFDENVLPIMEAGRAILVEMDHAIDARIRLVPTPGHTPGHVAVHISAGDQEAVVTGDLIHSPIQCRHPEWNYVWDDDKTVALETRRRFLETYSDTGAIILSSHFPAPSVGYLRADGDAFRFEYLAS